MVKVATAELAAVAKVRRNLYTFLSYVFLREPNGELITTLQEPGVVQAMQEMGIDLAATLDVGDKKQRVEDLAVEYARLFLGPGRHISPHESVQCGQPPGAGTGRGLLWGEATVKVKEFMERLGFGLDEGSRVIPDHLGVELELMARLAGREEEAWRRGDKSAALECLREEKAFLEEHILRWVPGFCQEVEGEAREEFYRQVAALTREFLQFDHEQVGETLCGA